MFKIIPNLVADRYEPICFFRPFAFTRNFSFIRFGIFLEVKTAGAWSWLLTSVRCQGREASALSAHQFFSVAVHLSRNSSPLTFLFILATSWEYSLVLCCLFPFSSRFRLLLSFIFHFFIFCLYLFFPFTHVCIINIVPTWYYETPPSSPLEVGVLTASLSSQADSSMLL